MNGLNDKSTERFFLALWPDSDTCKRIEAVQALLPATSRPMPVERLHLTLEFLGNLEPSSLMRLTEHLSQLDFAPFNERIDRSGFFEASGAIWIGPARPCESLLSLHNRINEICAKTVGGAQTETRPYVPHITLLRKGTQPLFDAFNKHRWPHFCWSVRAFYLVESNAGRYNIRARFAASR